MNNIAYLFDVDGTLTVSRQAIDKRFAVLFKKFCQQKSVYLVTGSDKPKTVEQIGETLFNLSRRVYNCSGNDVWEADNNIYTNEWRLPEKPWKYLESKLLHSKFAPKTGWHFEERPGMLNFSVLGRKANLKQRQMYIEWDHEIQERYYIAKEFNREFGEEFGIAAHIGGETGLDIMPTGCDKSQILKHFDDYDKVIFFGDRMEVGGNDHSLGQAILEQHRGIAQPVKNWQETETFLEKVLKNS